jgi:hypothetical protein
MLKRVIAVSQVVDNEKCALRYFLLKSGFIGVEYKVARKVLLSRLESDSALREVKSEN